jgi:hypothetical protein
MKSWREEELERLKKEYSFYKGTDIKDKLTGGLRSKTLKLIIDYHERMLGIKFWDDDMLELIHGNNQRYQSSDRIP